MVRLQHPSIGGQLSTFVHVGIQSTRKEEVDMDVTDDELLLTPAVVYGFSLSDKVWRTC